ncbi:MAG: hypothetical protein MJ229_06695 [bacterium]|nr:hypothetical protein [bacterium]
MITKEINEWIKKVENHQYNYEDAMYEFSRFAKYLTKEELIQIKKILEKY